MASFVCYVNLLIIFATQQKYHFSFMIPRSPFLSKQKQIKITFDLQKIAYIFVDLKNLVVNNSKTNQNYFYHNMKQYKLIWRFIDTKWNGSKNFQLVSVFIQETYHITKKVPMTAMGGFSRFRDIIKNFSTKFAINCEDLFNERYYNRVA